MNRKVKSRQRLIALVLTLAMMLSLVPAGAFAATDNGTQTGTIDIAINQEAPNDTKASMSAPLFAQTADVTVTGEDAVVNLYVIHPIPSLLAPGDKDEESVSNFTVTYKGVDYVAQSTINNGKQITASATNPMFGILAGKQYTAQTLSLKLPKDAVKDNTKLPAKTHVNPMNKDVKLTVVFTKVTLEQGVNPQPNPDLEKAQAVDQLIENIGPVTKDSEAKIKAARTAYDNLTAAQKNLVTKKDRLEQAEAQLEALKNPAQKLSVTFLNEKADDVSMCDVLFDPYVEVTEKGQNAELKFKIVNPVPAYPDQGKDGSVKDFNVAYNGAFYTAVSSLNTGATMTAKASNALFGLEKGETYPAQVLTLTLPKAALNENLLPTSAFVNVMMNKTVKFNLALNGYTPSPEEPALEKPVITPAEGEFEEQQIVEITAEKGTDVYYTLDGTEPTEKSTKYTEKIILTEDTTIKAIAVKGNLKSEVAVAELKKQTGDTGYFLKDGNYYVKVALWHEKDNQASMGNAAFENNQNALVTVKDGVVTTVQIATNPVEVGNIYSAITALKSPDATVSVLEKGPLVTKPAGKTYEYIKRASFQMPNDKEHQPSAATDVTYLDVSFVVPDTPMDAVAGADGLKARLKFDWSNTVETANGNLVQNGETGRGDNGGKVNVTDQATGIQLNTTADRVSKDAKFQVDIVTDNKTLEMVKKGLNNPQGKWMVYNINTLVDGKVVAPSGSVELAIPCGSAETEVYRFNPDGTKVAIQGQIKNGYYVFNTSKLGLFAVVDKTQLPIEKQFKDLSGHWAVNDIAFMVERGLFSGTSKDTFSPDASMTRGMFVSVLARLNGADLSKVRPSKFKDVDPSMWYAKSVAWAVENNIVSGTSATTFNPEGVITRQDMASILVRYAAKNNIKFQKVKSPVFRDQAAISDYAKESVDIVASAGLLVGMGDNKFEPLQKSTRAQVACMLARFVRTYSL